MNSVEFHVNVLPAKLGEGIAVHRVVVQEATECAVVAFELPVDWDALIPTAVFLAVVVAEGRPSKLQLLIHIQRQVQSCCRF